MDTREDKSDLKLRFKCPTLMNIFVQYINNQATYYSLIKMLSHFLIYFIYMIYFDLNRRVARQLQKSLFGSIAPYRLAPSVYP